MTRRTVCPACGRYGYVRAFADGVGKEFICSCGICVVALPPSNLKRELDRLAVKFLRRGVVA